MELEKKTNPTYTLTITHDEARALERYLNYTSVNEDRAPSLVDAQRYNHAGWALWRALDEELGR